MRDSRVPGNPLILGSMHPMTSGREPGWSINELSMVLQGGSQVPLFRRLVLQHGKARDDPPVHLIPRHPGQSQMLSHGWVKDRLR